MALNQYFTTDDISTYTIQGSTDGNSLLKKNLVGIYGAPYQFMSTVDPRIADSQIGAKYAEKIVSRMPLLFLVPCKQKFMPGFSSGAKETMLDSLVNGTEAASSITKSGRYYSTEYDAAEYYPYVDTMTTMLAHYLGIGDQVVNLYGENVKIKDIVWEKAVNDSLGGYIKANDAVVFYLDGLASISDSFSNGTTESSLSSTINGFSDQAKEIQFLLGSGNALSNMVDSMKESVGNGLDALSGSIGNVTNGMLGDLASTGVSTILTGGKIVFPKIWADSSYDRSYSFDIKLRSPDHDSTSIFFNILVPYIHLLAMTLPRGINDNPNGYTSPFLVKAYCKGLFNIDMGIITGMSVTRGAECQWNDDGLPTQMDVSIDIADLYSSLFMTGDTGLFGDWAVVNNTAMMDYIANLAGLNVADPEEFRKFTMLGYLTTADLLKIPSHEWFKFDEKIQNFIRNFYLQF
jgi:hypothetical protein